MEKKKVIKNSLIIAATLATTMSVLPKNISRAAMDEELGLTYSAHVQNKGWMNTIQASNAIESAIISGTSGEGLRAEAFKINFKGPENVKVKYNVHSENKGWTGWKTSGEIAGTVGNSLRAEALKVSVEGLEEYGYQMKYRAHVQDIGWMQWITADNSEDLTINYTGTTGRSLRMEAIEIVLVKVSENDQLKTQKEECISELNKYLIALGSTVEGEGTASEEKYEKIAKIIEEAIAEIEKAEKVEDVTETYNKTITEIKRAYVDADEIVKTVEEKANEARVKALGEIAIYKENLETANLSNSNKEIISSIIEKTENSVNAGKTKTEIDNALKNMKTLLEQYKDYDLSVAKTMAINDLSSYLDEANEGVKQVINEAIKKINEEIKTKNKLGEVVSETKAVIDEVIPAKEAATDELDLYESVLQDMDMTNASKAIVRNEINEVRTQIDNATKAEDVTNAMKAFGEYMNSYYSNVIKAKDEAILKNTMNDAIAKLTEYAICGYTDVEEKAIEDIEEIKELTTVEEIAEALEEKLEILEGMKQKAIQDEKDAQKSFIDEYEKAIDELNKYTDIVNNSKDLTTSEIEELNKLISNTKSNVENSKKTAEITEAMEVFTSFIKTYYEDINTQAGEYKLVKAKEEAIRKLNAYIDSEIADVATKAKAAISTIEATEDIEVVNNTLTNTIKDIEVQIAKADAIAKLDAYENCEVAGVSAKVTETETAINNASTVEDIKTTIKKAIEDIEAIIKAAEDANKLQNAKNEAVSKLTPYLTNDKFKAIASKAIKDINDCTSIEDIKTESGVVTKEGVKTILNKALTAIGVEDKTEEQKLIDSKTKALKIIGDYKTTATELQFTELSNRLKLYEDAVNEATKIEEIEDEDKGILAEVKAYIENNYPLLSDKLKAINDITKLYLDKEGTYKTYLQYKEYTNIVNKAINDIKAEDVKTTNEITAITNKLLTDTNEVKTSIDNYITAKTNAKSEITTYVASKGAVHNLIANTYIAKIDAVTYAKYMTFENNKEQSNTDTIFTSIIKDAKAAVDAYVE